MSSKWKYALAFASHIATLILASPISPRADVHNSASVTTTVANVTIARPFQYLSLNLDPTSPSSNDSATLTVSNDIHIRCDGAAYGFDLNITDCERAKAYFPPSSDQVQWAERHTGSFKRFFPLPYRSMGDEGSCYVQPVLVGGAASAFATPNQVRNAAAAIRDVCASGGILRGGIATGIGGDNNLAVIMGVYKTPSTTPIQCGKQLFSPNSCRDVLDDMPATAATETFALAPQSPKTIQLPHSVMSEDEKCLLGIYASSQTAEGSSDTASWYEVWEATVATWSVCGRQGRGGFVNGIGDHGGLELTLENVRELRNEKGPMALQASKIFGTDPDQRYSIHEESGYE